MIVPSTPPVKMSNYFRSNVQLIISLWWTDGEVPAGRSKQLILSSSSSPMSSL